MNDVDCRDQIKRVWRVNVSDVLRVEARVRHAPPLSFSPSPRYALVNEVIAGESTVGKRFGHHVDKMSSATTEVGSVDASAKAVRQFWHEFDAVAKQIRVGIRVIDGY